MELAPSGGLTQAQVTTTPKPPPALANKPVVVLPKGPPPKQLVIKDLIPGTGKTAGAGQTVTVNYVGVLYKGGKEFDSSWKRNQPFTTALSKGSVIQGWVKGIAGMRVGGRRELIIPPESGLRKSRQPTHDPAQLDAHLRRRPPVGRLAPAPEEASAGWAFASRRAR